MMPAVALVSFFLFFQSGGNDGEDDRSSAGGAAAPPEPFRPRDTLVQDYLGKEGAEQFLSDWDEERSSTSSLSSSPRPPSPRALSPCPPPPVVATSLGGDGAALGAASKAQQHLAAECEKRRASMDGTSSPSPPTSPSSGTRRRAGALGGGREPPATGLTAARISLGDPGLERWASSMVALGKAARAGTGGYPPPVGKPGTGDPTVGSPSVFDSSPGRSSRGSSRAPEDSDDSCAPPPLTSRQDQHQRQHQHQHRHRRRHRQLQGPAQEGTKLMAREAPSGIEQGREETSTAEGHRSGDSALLRPSSPRTSEPEGFADDDGVSPGSRGGDGVCGGRATCSVGDGDGDGGGDGAGIRVVSLAARGDGDDGSRRREGAGEWAVVDCADENELSALMVKAAPRGPPPPPPPLRCSLFDLADQSIDEI